LTAENIQAERDVMRHLGDEFARERLGIPSEPDNTAGVFPAGTWGACTDPTSTIPDGGRTPIAFDVATNHTYAAFATAGLRTDGLLHGELIERHPGTGWVLPRAKHYTDRYGSLL